MLCLACTDVLSRKQTVWRGSYQSTFGPPTEGQPSNSVDDAVSEAGRDSEGAYAWRDSYVHHPSGQAFLAAAQQGCPLCILLVSQLSLEQRRVIVGGPVDTSPEDYDYVTTYRNDYEDEYMGRSCSKDTPYWSFRGSYNPQSLHLGDYGISFDAVFVPARGKCIWRCLCLHTLR